MFRSMVLECEVIVWGVWGHFRKTGFSEDVLIHYMLQFIQVIPANIVTLQHMYCCSDIHSRCFTLGVSSPALEGPTSSNSFGLEDLD